MSDRVRRPSAARVSVVPSFGLDQKPALTENTSMAFAPFPV